MQTSRTRRTADGQNAQTITLFCNCVFATALLISAPLTPAAAAPGLEVTGSGYYVSPAAGPVWRRVVHLDDGRTLVSDGPLALDLALTKPAALPTQTLPEASGKLVQKYLTAEL